MAQKFELTYKCTQSWDNMSPSSNGRYCEFCSKTVIDFTNLSSKEINKFSGEKDLCARFYPSQMDTAIVKPIESSKYLKLMLFFSALSISISGKNLINTDSNNSKIELSSSKISAEAFVLIDDKKKKHSDSTDVKVKVREPFHKGRKRQYFWSKRFPFIVAERYHTKLHGNVRFLED